MNDPTDDVFGGFSRVELQRAFDRVKPAGDWKEEIDAEVEIANASDLAAICAAIEFFTATIPRVTRVKSKAARDRYAIKAAGYRMGPAGDH